MTSQSQSLFHKVNQQLDGLHQELSALSKKNPNDAVNKFKLQFINDVLSEANNILKDQYRPFARFSTFDEESMPTNSDVVLIIGQYLKCMARQSIEQ